MVVNCSGLQAAALTHDASLRPVRGQIVHVPNDIGLEDAYYDEGRGTELTCVFPFEDHIVLGGTYEPGVDATTPDETACTNLMQRCRALLQDRGHRGADRIGKTMLRRFAALRPGRCVSVDCDADVRCECEFLGSFEVIHNYGHGGAGVTLSWGLCRSCARVGRQGVLSQP